MSNDKTVTMKQSTLWKIVAGVFGLLFIIALFTGGFGMGRGDVTGNAGAQPNLAAAGNPTQPSNPNVDIDKLADDDPFLGNKNAKVTIVEFSDFQCPFCRSFWKSTLPSIKEKYIDIGKVKFVYRDFPLTSIHPGAQPAAEAAECADDQGKFWEYHDKIFGEQDKFGQGTIQFGVAELKQWASEIGLNTNDFNDCLDSGKYRSEVQKDLNDGSAVGITGTPGFYINGQKVTGAQPFQAFQQVIDSYL